MTPEKPDRTKLKRLQLYYEKLSKKWEGKYEELFDEESKLMASARRVPQPAAPLNRIRVELERALTDHWYYSAIANYIARNQKDPSVTVRQKLRMDAVIEASRFMH